MKKTITTSIFTALASIGSMFGYYDTKLSGAEAILVDTQVQLEQAVAEKNAVVTAKQDVLKDYVYSQIRLKDTPSFDLTFVSVDEINQAYIDLVNEKQVTYKLTDDLFTKLREKTISEGTACFIN